MKTNNYFLHIILTLLLCCAGTKTFAYDIAVSNSDGVTIYYNYINDGTELEVAWKSSYTGTINIPEYVTYNDKTYSVTAIGAEAFKNCTGLTSVTIPNSVTSIGANAFAFCSGLTSMTIPNSVISIGHSAFYVCSGLTSVTIPNSVTSIDYTTFFRCSGLTSVTIPNSVISIGNSAFNGCSGLTSVTIPNSVTSIGSDAFCDCISLTSITIPSSMTLIGGGAFSGCNIQTVISQIETPFNINGIISDYRTFSRYTFNNATLYVPTGTIDNYKATQGWMDFKFIEEGTGTGIAQIPANAVLIQANGGFISISGLGDSERVAIYQTDGKQVATAKAYNGCASVATNISKGTPVIVKIGEKAVKVVMQ